MKVLLKIVAALFGAAIAYVLAIRYAWALSSPQGVALICFVGTLAGLFALRDGRGGAGATEPARASSLARRRSPFSSLRRGATGLFAFALLVLGAGLVYDQRDAIANGAKQLLNGLQPGRAIALSPGEALLRRGYGGHFTAVVSVGDHTVRMLVDTGSTDVALPYEEAERIGIDVAALSFEHEVVTANGPARVALVTLPSVQVGPIEILEVRASVAEPGRLSSALLGMSFLGQLSEVSFSGDRLRLRR